MSARCSTSQSDRLKAVFESIRDIITECRLIFYSDRMVFIGQDNGHVMILKYVIIAKEIEATGGEFYFDSPAPIKININVKTIAQHLRRASTKDIITFQIDPSVMDRLIIRIRNPSTGKNSTAHIVIPQSKRGDDEEECVTEEFIDKFKPWTGYVSMTSAAYHDMIQFVSMAGTDDIRLYCDMRGDKRNRLEMSAEGIMTRNMYVVTDKRDDEAPASIDGSVVGGGGDTGVYFKTDTVDETKWPVDSLYPLEFLSRVAKAKSVSTKLSLFVRQNYPLCVVFEAKIGVLTFIITTRERDDAVDLPTRMVDVPVPVPTQLIAAAAAAPLKRPYIKIEPKEEVEEPPMKKPRIESESEEESSGSESDDSDSDSDLEEDMKEEEEE